jgi:hypothetical protein
MYSICFQSNRDHPLDKTDTFIEYLQKLNLGRIYRVRRIPVNHGVHLFVHFSWFGDDSLRKDLDAGIKRVLFIWPNGNPLRGIDFVLVKTSVPSDMSFGLPIDPPSPQYDCQII